MDKLTKQSVCLLAAASAAMATIITNKVIGDKELLADITVAHELSFNMINSWPKVDNKVIRWSTRRLKEWRAVLDGQDDDLSIPALIAAASQAMSDLHDKLYDGDSKESVGVLLITLQRATDFFYGDSAYPIAADILQPLYDLIGFEP